MFLRLLILCVFFSPGWISAQELIFCLDHTKSGNPLARGIEFDLDQFGQDIDFLYRAGLEIETSQIYIFIDRKQDSSFVEWDTKSMKIQAGQTWASFHYRFDRSGLYRIVMLNAEKKEIVRGNLKVTVLRDVGGPSYFQDARVEFCYEVLDGNAKAPLGKISLGVHKRRDVKVLVKHFRSLRCKMLVVDVWRDKDVYVETMQFKVEPEWTYTQFAYSFRDPGAYSFRAYSEDQVWIGTGQIVVNR